MSYIDNKIQEILDKESIRELVHTVEQLIGMIMN